MTTSERNSINSPVDGLQIFNTSTGCLNYYFNAEWIEVCGPTAFSCVQDTVEFTYNNQSTSDTPINNSYITSTSGNVDWRNPQNNNL